MERLASWILWILRLLYYAVKGVPEEELITAQLYGKELEAFGPGGESGAIEDREGILGHPAEESGSEREEEFIGKVG